jgi:hypothetical protein
MILQGRWRVMMVGMLVIKVVVVMAADKRTTSQSPKS